MQLAATWTTDMDGTVDFACQLGPLSLTVGQPGGGLLSGIGTGALVWTAGLALATALAEADDVAWRLGLDDLAATRALELGAGCSALPSVALALAGAKRVTATDTAEVIASLRPNLAAYQAAATRAGVCPHLQASVEPRPLSWVDRRSLAALANEAEGHGLVLAADVDWMEDLHEALADMITACLAPSPRAVALLASSSSGRDRDDTLRRFLAVLAARGLALVELAASLAPLKAASAVGEGAAAPSAGGARFFAARWTDEQTARGARERVAKSACT